MNPKPKPVREPKPRRVNQKTRRKALEAKLDKLVSKIVILRDGKCMCCGSTQQLTCGHWQVRGLRGGGLRWDTRNCNCQCWPCNVRHRHYQAVYDAAMLRRYGEAVCLELCDMVNEPKLTVPELEELHERLTGELDTLQHTSLRVPAY